MFKLKPLMSALAVGTLFTGLATAQTTPSLDLTSAPSITAVSGGSGEGRLITFAPTVGGLQEIGWVERGGNVPCWIRINGRPLTESTGLGEALNFCGNRNGATTFSSTSTFDSDRSVGFESRTNPFFVTGLQVCTNRNGTRLKGLRVRGSRLTADGGLEPMRRVREATQPNCQAWDNWVDCPAGQVAIGIEAQLAAGRAPVAITGMALACQPIQATPVAGRLDLAGRASDADGVSGFPGNAVRLRINGGYATALDTITFAERGDAPCFLRVAGSPLRAPEARDGERMNQCGDRGATNRSRRTVSLQPFDGFHVITGLQVCMNGSGRRVKGIAIEGMEPGDNRTVTDSAIQANCPGGGWQPVVRCPAGQVAVGLVAHYENRANRPRSLTGLGLTCRPYRQAR